MTDYTDVPQANALYQQREFVTQVITLIDGGGLLTQFMVGPKPPDPGSMLPTAGVATQVMVPPDSVTPDIMANLRAWCVSRQTTIDTEMANLGVANPPSSRRESA